MVFSIPVLYTLRSQSSEHKFLSFASIVLRVPGSTVALLRYYTWSKYCRTTLQILDYTSNAVLSASHMSHVPCYMYKYVVQRIQVPSVLEHYPSSTV
jgi:hypothetical protein